MHENNGSGTFAAGDLEDLESLEVPVAVAVRDCPGCLKTLPVTRFYTYGKKHRQKHGRDNYRNPCKSCYRSKNREKYGTQVRSGSAFERLETRVKQLETMLKVQVFAINAKLAQCVKSPEMANKAETAGVSDDRVTTIPATFDTP